MLLPTVHQQPFVVSPKGWTEYTTMGYPPHRRLERQADLGMLDVGLHAGFTVRELSGTPERTLTGFHYRYQLRQTGAAPTGATTQSTVLSNSASIIR